MPVKNEVRGVGTYVQRDPCPTPHQNVAFTPSASISRTENTQGGFIGSYSTQCLNYASIDDKERHASQIMGHTRVHSGGKPYKCDQSGCGKAFARNEELTRHKKIHSGVKTYVCDTCDKAFGRKDHLSKHEKTHLKASDKKMHRCYIVGCNHEYTRSDALARHLSTAHSSVARR